MGGGEMTKKKILQAIRAAAIVLFVAAIVFLVYSAVLHGLSEGGVEREGPVSSKVSDTGPGNNREASQVIQETVAEETGGAERGSYARYDLSLNLDRESAEGMKAAAASAFGEWLRNAACEKDVSAIIEMLNVEAVQARGREIDAQAAAGKVITEWGEADKEILYTGHYYGGSEEEYVAKFCLAKPGEGTPELEYELENSSIHEITIYFDESGLVVFFLPFPAQAMAGYGRQYGIK